MQYTREHGTTVTVPSNGAERINAIRQVLNNHQYAKIDGIMVDGFTASAIIQVYDAINDTNKDRFKNMPVWKMAEIAYKFCK